MENVLQKIKVLLKLNKNTQKTSKETINSLHTEVEGVFAGFKRMHNQLGEVNDKLETVVQCELEELKKAQENIELAKKELEINCKLRKKVEEFLV